MMEFNEMIGGKSIVFVTSRQEIEILSKKAVKDNVTATTFHMVCSIEPLVYSISVGKSSLTAELIGKAGCFCVNFLSDDYKKEAEFCMAYSGRHIDKFVKTSLGKEECETIDCARIKQATAWIECETINQIEAGNSIVFIGKVTRKVSGGDDNVLSFSRDRNI
jgi:flavin reductase (DIM6/NTAB) family NADH-FMN oxidoreductase RutF